DGSFDPTFVLDVIIQSGPIRIVGDAYSLAVQVDGRIIVGGNFNTLGGQSSTNIGRLNLDGSLDPTFHAGASGSVYSLAISADGKILVGGAFSSLAGQPRQSVGRLAPNTASVQKLMIDACGTTVTWIRNGALPEVEQVTFEVSLDGLNFVFVGRGARVNGGWQLAGLALPTGQHFYLRARGRTIGGIYNGSSGLMESVALFYRLPPPFLSSVQVLGGGMFQFYFTNTTATAFTVLASSDLTLQASQWTSLGAPLLVGGGLYQFTDSGATNFTRRFYQLRTP
ncbi:MAG TPA: delta-60 repeat domain-containing protein, partial [Verrucomicrobiae bacterium]